MFSFGLKDLSLAQMCVYYLKFALMDYRRKRWCHFVGIATKWLCKFNPYQANHVHSTKDGGRGKLSCKCDLTPVTSTWWYQSCSKVHISPLEDYGSPERRCLPSDLPVYPQHSARAGSVAGARQHPRAAVARKQLGLPLR